MTIYDILDILHKKLEVIPIAFNEPNLFNFIHKKFKYLDLKLKIIELQTVPEDLYF